VTRAWGKAEGLEGGVVQAVLPCPVGGLRVEGHRVAGCSPGSAGGSGQHDGRVVVVVVGLAAARRSRVWPVSPPSPTRPGVQGIDQGLQPEGRLRRPPRRPQAPSRLRRRLDPRPSRRPHRQADERLPARRRGRHREAGDADHRADLARFLLDTLEKDTWIRKAPSSGTHEDDMPQPSLRRLAWCSRGPAAVRVGVGGA
jgi:hypothetical protein